MNLLDAEVGREYVISGIQTDDEEMDDFLFSLGCFSGESITVVSHTRNGYVISIKDARYTIDRFLAQAIQI
ncbi:MAG: ferrous iron transport protein A [Ruminococcaceae bacterium]|nr:ferrous iron transport protein A [Oscillospiraceae bacterium]